MVKQCKKKRKIWNKILACLGMILMLANCFTGIVQAGDYIPDQKGSFTLTLQETDAENNTTPLKDVALNLYKVGGVDTSDGNVHFIIDDKLSFTGIDFDTIESAGDWYTAAEKISTAVTEAGLTATQGTSDAEGKVVYSDLEQGMYLIIQGDADSKVSVSPMLLSVPFVQEGEGWIYDVQAYPKAETKPVTTAINVTKRLYYINSSTFERTEMNTEDGTYKIGLYLDKAGTIPYGGDYLKEINIKNASSGTATYSDVPDGTYYIFELDENNKPMTLNQEMQVANGRTYFYNVTDSAEKEDNSTTISKETTPETVAYVNNNYYYLPDGYYLSGKIDIKKRVLVGGQESTVNDTFYAGVFEKNSDGSLKLVQTVELKQNDTVTVTIPFEQNTMPDKVTYTVKETDKDGNILNANDFPYAISGEGDVTLEQSQQYKGSIELTNSKDAETTPGATNTPAPGSNDNNNGGNGNNTPANNNGGSTSQSPVKTGDTSNPAMWALILICSAIVIGIFVKRARKQK